MPKQTSTITREQIYLAALLHDVGKFYERAFPKKYEKDEIFNYSHAVYTRAFYDDYNEVQQILKRFDFGKNLGDFNLINLAAKHHNPSNNWEKLIQFADWLASSERRPFDDMDYKEGKLHQALLSIFTHINLEDKTNISKINSFLPLQKLSIKELPKLTPTSEIKEDDYKNLWKAFLEEFTLLKGLSIENFNETFLKLLEKYTTFIPSSTRKDEIPDITLFDHSKMTAAFAIAIYNYLQENGLGIENVNKALSIKEKPYLIIGGDLSGIQKFIYDIINKNAAKNLKGRSFFLKILMETIVRNILKELNLKKANIIYNTGGNFYILAQNTTQAKEKLKKLVADINKEFLAKYNNLLYLAVDYVEFSFVNLIPQVSCLDENCKKYQTREETLKNLISYLDIDSSEIKSYNEEPNLGKLWEILISEKINIKKQQKHLEFLRSEDGYKFFFEPFDLEQNVKTNKAGAFLRDKITGEFILKNENTENFGENDKIKETTKKQIQLGKLLREADYWIITKNPLEGSDKYIFAPFENENLNFIHYFLPEKILKQKKDKIENCEIIVLNNPENFLKAKTVINKNNQFLFDFYGGNDFPAYSDENLPAEKIKEGIEKGDPVQFDDLAKGKYFSRLGILRMDVDSLGKIFAKGFEKKIKIEDNKLLDELKKTYPSVFDKDRNLIDKGLITFSRLATLSRSLDFYFSGYLNTIWKERFSDSTMILYSGGDDVFIIGRWDKTLDFAYEIREQFKKWTANNPNITISGGLELVPGKFPILKAANDAGEAESKAKRHTTSNGLSKNSLTFLDMPLNWDEEFIYVKKWYEIMKDLINKNNLPKGFLSTVQRFYELCKHQIKNDKNLSWQWLILYYSKRLQERSKVAGRRFLDNFMKDILAMHSFTEENNEQKTINSHYITLELTALAARWAELWLRTN